MEIYYVASLRGSGWFSRSSQFNTQLSEAKEMNYLEAIALCRRYKSNGHSCVPVRKSDMSRIDGSTPSFGPSYGVDKEA